MGFVAYCLSVFLVAASPAVADEKPAVHVVGNGSAAELAAKPVTTARGPAGDLLKQWYAEKTAAGNVGDCYDNRDRGHSQLDLSLYPQLSKTVYNESARKLMLDWAGTLRSYPSVVFGNSSTSAGPREGGSNPRMMFTAPGGLRGLYVQYTSNNLYMYPEHCDYRPGHNGTPNHGNLYPTNTPFVLISQGSSGSDQPFMRAVPLTLAAFQPEVKKKLVRCGLLMPTVQMIFRMTAKQLSKPEDYLTGKAHPPVFDGAQVDSLAMVQLAHKITADAIPPMVQLKVVEEDSPVRGRDYFEENLSEELGTTPAVIARIFRSCKHTHRIVVSADDSFDRNDRPLRFHWSVLHGDPAKVSIKPLNARGSTAEIVVSWHDRRPVGEGSPLETNRVDIGVFVHNGAYYSAPGFVTFFCPDSEARTYEPDGRLLEIGYGAGDVDIQTPDLSALLKAFEPGPASPGMESLRAAFTKEQTAAILRTAPPYRLRHAEWQSAVALREAAQKAKRPESELKSLRNAETAAVKAEQDVLNQGRDVLHNSVGDAILAVFRSMVGDPYLFRSSGKVAAAALRDPRHKTEFTQLIRRFVGWGLFRETADSPEKLTLTPLRKAAATDPAALTRFEKVLLQQFHAEWLGRFVYPGLATFSYRSNYVDPQISAPKRWRDLYHYDAHGLCTGWTRRDGEREAEFMASGMLVVKKGDAGQPVTTVTVRYERDKPKFDPAHPHVGPNWNPLRWTPEE